MYAFDLVRPATVADAVKALAEEGAQALGGGQTLIPTLKARLASPGTLVSLGAIAELRGVRTEGDTLRIGGGTSHATVAREAAAA
jgi:carbon-monoxide dehydrogenase medium subunit